MGAMQILRVGGVGALNLGPRSFSSLLSRRDRLEIWDSEEPWLRRLDVPAAYRQLQAVCRPVPRYRSRSLVQFGDFNKA